MTEATVYFWQRIVTPHMAYLADALADSGRQVIYVANESMSTDRQRMGWAAPELVHAKLLIAADVDEVNAQVRFAPPNSIHICQGLRGNGLVGVAQKTLAGRGLRQWALMETVDDAGFAGVVKRLVYRWLLWRWHAHLQGILAIGWRTNTWLASRGASAQSVFSFAYFLSDARKRPMPKRPFGSPFRWLFVGQLIPRKRLDSLIQALAPLSEYEFELVVIGEGTMQQAWEAEAGRRLPGRVHWLGGMPMAEVADEMARADGLVLPSRHDGWGAVVSEALMVGTPVICSDACGAAGVAAASGVGGVFPASDLGALIALLRQMMVAGPLATSERTRLAQWAKCLGAKAGAGYLAAVLAHADGGQVCPSLPWEPLDSAQRGVR